jgi:HAD superfamily hydrolase (TIGR01544 family)
MNSGVHIRDVNALEAKLRQIGRAGLHELQIVADFDGTLSYHRSRADSAIRALSCHGVIGKHPAFSDAYREKVQQMEDHYGSLEKDPSLSDELRLGVMTDWWGKSHALMISQQISINTVEEMVLQASARGMFGLRKSSRDFLISARASHIPTIILSAGISVVINELLKSQNIPTDDLTAIVSNQTICDAYGVLQAFVEPVIHGMSKRSAVARFIRDSVVREGRNNFLLLGDMPHDVEVLEQVEGVNAVISIGFLMDETHLEEYLDLYDVVVTRDGDFGIVLDVFKKLKYYST